MLRGHIFDAIAQDVFRAAHFQKDLSSNSIYIEREISVGWRRTVAIYLHISTTLLYHDQIIQLCRLCYKYCGIGRYRLSVVFVQIAG